MLTKKQIRKLSNRRLILKVAEEASEVIKAVMKHGAHGARPKAKGVQYDNVRDTNEEASQLNSLLREYRRRNGSQGHV
jgi:hypothetical protein